MLVKSVSSVFAACFFVVLSHCSWAQVNSWNNSAGGEFHDAANWNLGSPSANDDCRFGLTSNFSVDLLGDAAIRSFDFRRGNVTLTGGFRFDADESSSIGSWPGPAATLTVGDGILLNPKSELLLGTQNGTGHMIQDDGGKILVGDFLTEHHSQFAIGGDFGGKLQLANGSTVQTGDWVYVDGNEGSTNELIIEDPDSLFSALSMWIGNNGENYVEVRNGGQLNTDQILFIGQGNLTIRDPGTLLTAERVHAYDGTLTVANGARISLEDEFNYVWMTEEMAAHFTNSDTLVVGSLDIEGGSLQVDDGAQTEGRFFIVGDGPTSTVTYSGTGTSGKCDIAYVGYDVDDNEDDAHLYIQADASFTAFQSLSIGSGHDSGYVEVDGLNSKLFVGSEHSISGDGLELLEGESGEANLTLSNGGQVFVGDDNPMLTGNNLVISDSGGSVDLIMENGAEISGVENAYLGYSDGCSGLAILSGASTAWVIGNSLTIGLDGSGELDLSEGSRVRADTIFVARNGGSSGEVSIVGIGSLLDAVDDLEFGDEGQATVECNTGGGLSAGDQIRIGNEGVVSLTQANATAARWQVNGVLNIDDSTLTGQVSVGAGGAIDVLGGSVNFPEGLTNLGLVSIADEAELTINNGYFGNGEISGTGELLIHGDVEFGPTPSTLRFDGTFRSSVTTNVKFRIGGQEPSQFDRLVVETFNAGLLDLGGFEVELFNGYSVGPGEQYIIVSATNRLYTHWNGLTEGDLVTTLGGEPVYITFEAGDGNDIALYTDGVRTISPQVMTITRGVLAAGDAQTLAQADGVDVSIRRSNTDIQSRTEFEITSVSPILSPTTMEVNLKGSVFARTSVVQSIGLFNFDTNSWVQIDSRDASRFIDRIDTIAITGNVARFVELGTGQIKARVNFQSENPRQQFTSNTDGFNWQVGN